MFQHNSHRVWYRPTLQICREIFLELLRSLERRNFFLSIIHSYRMFFFLLISFSLDKWSRCVTESYWFECEWWEDECQIYNNFICLMSALCTFASSAILNHTLMKFNKIRWKSRFWSGKNQYPYILRSISTQMHKPAGHFLIDSKILPQDGDVGSH